MSKSNAAKRRRQAKARAAVHAQVTRSTADHDRDTPAPPATTAITADAFDQWLISLWTLRLASVLLATAVCAGALFGVLLNGRERAQQLYESARVCAAASTADCVILLDTTISGKSESGGKTPRYLLTLAGPAPASGQIELLREPVWDGMNVGDGVTATVWNGQVVHIADGPISGDTSSVPSIETATVAAMFASSIAWVAAFALFAIRLFEVGRGRALGWSRALIPVNPAVAPSVFVFPLGSLLGATGGSTLEALLSGASLSVVAGSYFVVNWVRKRHPRAVGS